MSLSATSTYGEYLFGWCVVFRESEITVSRQVLSIGAGVIVWSMERDNGDRGVGTMAGQA